MLEGRYGIPDAGTSSEPAVLLVAHVKSTGTGRPTGVWPLDLASWPDADIGRDRTGRDPDSAGQVLPRLARYTTVKLPTLRTAFLTPRYASSLTTQLSMRAWSKMPVQNLGFDVAPLGIPRPMYGMLARAWATFQPRQTTPTDGACSCATSKYRTKRSRGSVDANPQHHQYGSTKLNAFRPCHAVAAHLRMHYPHS